MMIFPSPPQSRCPSGRRLMRALRSDPSVVLRKYERLPSKLQLITSWGFHWLTKAHIFSATSSSFWRTALSIALLAGFLLRNLRPSMPLHPIHDLHLTQQYERPPHYQQKRDFHRFIAAPTMTCRLLSNPVKRPVFVRSYIDGEMVSVIQLNFWALTMVDAHRLNSPEPATMINAKGANSKSEW
ncbi:hypothetical protein C8J56DRAFT_1053542 [Mycena floridula]|nr:hypothetical protein C8J56DRAFT_1053542 [Mycena floridula]